MTSTASREHDPDLWPLVVRGTAWLQTGFGACYFATFILYGWARATTESHDSATDVGNDPKDLGSGLGTLLARALHALGMGSAVVSPYAGVSLGVVTLLGYLVSRRVRADSAVRAHVIVALCVSVAVATVGSMDAVSDIRHWMLD